MIDGVRALIEAEKALGGGPRARTAEEIVASIRAQLAEAGPRTLRSLTRNFTVTGPAGSRKVNNDEFFTALASLGVDLSDSCKAVVQACCDPDNSGSLNYDAFLIAVRG